MDQILINEIFTNWGAVIGNFWIMFPVALTLLASIFFSVVDFFI